MRIILFLLLLLPLTTHAVSVKKIYSQWIGASEAELTAKWGYPETQNDVVKISDEVKNYTYRSYRRGWGGPAGCIVTFTINKGVVSYWKYRGAHCPKIKRYKKKRK